MKKRGISIFMAAMICASALTACGSGAKDAAAVDIASVSESEAGVSDDEKVLRIAFPDTLTTVEVDKRQANRGVRRDGIWKRYGNRRRRKYCLEAGLWTEGL